MTTLLIADVVKGQMGDATAKAMTAAAQLGAPVHILVAGKDCDAAAQAAAKLDGVEKVLTTDNELYDHQLAEPMAALVVSLAEGYSSLVASATTTAKNIMPRVAALLDVMQISEIIKVVSADTFERPIYAGNAIGCPRKPLTHFRRHWQIDDRSEYSCRIFYWSAEERS